MRRNGGKRTRTMLGILLAAVCLAGCGTKEGDEKTPNDAGMNVSETAESESQMSENQIAETPENSKGGEQEAEKDVQLPGQQAAEEKTEDNGKAQTEADGSAGRIKRITADGKEMREAEPPEGFELTLASEDWGLSFGESGTQPVGNASVEELVWYDAYYMDDDSGKVIYLTFDCGYENGNTQPILEALKKHRAPATFFVVGHFLETAPDLVKQMVEEGHVVGNHTYHHPDMSAISERADFQKELDDVAELFHEITGTELSGYYRPPQGKCNVDNMKMAQECGYQTVFWSLAYVDWDTEKQPGHEEALAKLTARIHPGAIVLLHNTSQTNGEILDELLTKWEEMGYSFAPLSEMKVSVDTDA